MVPICDYHMHTPLCGHAAGEPIEYARHALKIGFKEIGFSDHAPLLHTVNPKVTMGISQLPLYYELIEEVQNRYKNELTIKIALEADFIPGYESKIKAMLDQYPLDYVIGSVHFIKDWGFDDPDQRNGWDRQDINKVYENYFRLLRLSAQSGLFNIMGHVDLVKKFGHRPTIDMTDEVSRTARSFKDAGVAVEINTSGLRKPVKEMYPALDHLKVYQQAGVPLTFGSDAHDPQDVGKNFLDAVDLARAAGYTEYVLFKNRKIEKRIGL